MDKEVGRQCATCWNPRDGGPLALCRFSDACLSSLGKALGECPWEALASILRSHPTAWCLGSLPCLLSPGGIVGSLSEHLLPLT